MMMLMMMLMLLMLKLRLTESLHIIHRHAEQRLRLEKQLPFAVVAIAGAYFGSLMLVLDRPLESRIHGAGCAKCNK
jgi:hypothetical protein